VGDHRNGRREVRRVGVFAAPHVNCIAGGNRPAVAHDDSCAVRIDERVVLGPDEQVGTEVETVVAQFHSALCEPQGVDDKLTCRGR
jgi:hypothetical protein